MDKPTFYEIRVKGHLEKSWDDWFEGLTISNLDSGEALISGYVADQAALHGLINRINNLGLTLVSVSSVTSED